MPRRLFTEEHQIFRESFRKFLEKEVIPFLDKWEHDKIVPKDVWMKMGESGFLLSLAGRKIRRIKRRL